MYEISLKKSILGPQVPYRYHNAHKENWDEERIISEFPIAVAQVIGMDAEKAYKDIAATTDLETGLDALLDG